MMSQEKASQYMVVAWVKDWPLRLYLKTVAEQNDYKWGDAHKAFPWLPADIGWFIRNQTTRRYVADAFRTMNDKLYDAPDNKDRINLASQFLALNGKAAKQQTTEAQKELKKAKRAYRQALHQQAFVHDRVTAANRGHFAWNVCK